MQDIRFTEHFNSSNPSSPHSKDSVLQRWVLDDNDSQVSPYFLEYTYDLRYIHDFNSNRINDASRKEDWWSLEKREQEKSLGDKKVFLPNYPYNSSIDKPFSHSIP